MATKLHQILAVEAGVRAQSAKDITALHHSLKKPELLFGQNRTYEPLKEDGEKLPAERQILQFRVQDVVRESIKIWARMFDITATRDYANIDAKADIVVDGQTLVKNAPTAFLLWLEKKLEDLHTFVAQLPTLPADIEWEWDDKQNCYKNKQEIKSAKTAKIMYPLVLAPATKEHPAQVSKESRDEVVGYWTTLKYSGALKVQDVKEMKDRVEILQKAVRFAREKANEVEVTDQKVGDALLKYVFGKLAQ